MATGKVIGKWTKVYFDDTGGTAREITNDVISVDGLPVTYDELEVSGFGQDKMYLPGKGDSQISLTMKYTTTADTGTHTVFSGYTSSPFTVGTLTVQIGENAAPVSTNPEFEGEFIVTSYVPSLDASSDVPSTVTLRVANGQSLPAWGTVA